MSETIKGRLAIRVIRLLARAQAKVHYMAFGEDVWVSVDGTPWKYHELKDNHLANILRKLHREGDQPDIFVRLCDEADQRGLKWRGEKLDRWKKGQGWN